MTPDYRRALIDIIAGAENWRVWTRMGWQEIRRRYRRTMLGPFWVTLSLGLFVGGMGFVWAPLFKVPVKDYLPFVTTGMICWTFTSSIIIEGCSTYTSAESLIKQLSLPLSMLNWMLVCRNTIVLFHNLLIAIIVYAALGIIPSLNFLLFFPGLVLVCINGVWMGILLGMVSARFRDVPQLVGSLVQVMMFVTPVFWYASQLSAARANLLLYNPLMHLIDVIRMPLLGQAPTLLNYAVVIGMALTGWSLAIFVFARFRRRIAYWL